jgi:glycosyltransferase involved in cell wall biosynthesis
LYTIHGLPLMTVRGIWRRVLEQAERTSCTLASRVYTVSLSLGSVIAEMRLCCAEKLHMLGDGSCAGVDLEKFEATPERRQRAFALRAEYKIPLDAFLLTLVGRIAHDKGVSVLASAWPELARQFPKLHLLIAGQEDESDPVSPTVLQQFRRDERVHFTAGWASDMPAVYAATDLVVLPSFREGLSQVALEAGAMGIPIVSTRIPGLINSVQEGITGLLVPAGETQPLIDAIRRLLEDPALRAALGVAGRQFIRERFSDKRVNQLWVSEYRMLASGSLSKVMTHWARPETSR